MSERERPLIAIVFSVPLLAEALTTTLASVGESRAFAARHGDVDGLLRWIAPDAVVVDDEDLAGEASAWVEEADAPLVLVTMRPPQIRLLAGGVWTEADGAGATPEGIRNVVAGALYGKGVSR